MNFNLPLSFQKRAGAVLLSLTALSAGVWGVSQIIQPAQAAASR